MMKFLVVLIAAVVAAPLAAAYSLETDGGNSSTALESLESRAFVVPATADLPKSCVADITKAGSSIGAGVAYNKKWVVTLASNIYTLAEITAFGTTEKQVNANLVIKFPGAAAAALSDSRKSRNVIVDLNATPAKKTPLALIEICPSVDATVFLATARVPAVGTTLPTILSDLYVFIPDSTAKVHYATRKVAEVCECDDTTLYTSTPTVAMFCIRGHTTDFASAALKQLGAPIFDKADGTGMLLGLDLGPGTADAADAGIAFNNADVIAFLAKAVV